MPGSRSGTRLTIYNHKGGVGKTTLTVNVGAALAVDGFRVLLVDSDPQCNLTSFFLADDVVNELLDTSETPDGRTIWSAVKPIVDQTGDIQKVEPYETVVDDLYLLPGDIRMSLFEQTLGDAWTDCFKRKLGGIRATTALSRLIDSLTKEYEFDYVLYDTGPNIGPLNRVILLDCDGFVVPVACDLFSMRALTTLGQTLKMWTLDWKSMKTLAPDGWPMLTGEPRFLGYVPQQFKTYGQTMTHSASYYLGKVQRHVQSDIVNVLKKVSPDLVPSDSRELKLGEVKQFGSVIQKAQREGVPLLLIQGVTSSTKDAAWQAFYGIAQAVVAATGVRRGKTRAK